MEDPRGRFRRERRARGTRRQAPHRPPVGSREPRVENRELRDARLEIPQGREGDNDRSGGTAEPLELEPHLGELPPRSLARSAAIARVTTRDWVAELLKQTCREPPGR